MGARLPGRVSHGKLRAPRTLSAESCGTRQYKSPAGRKMITEEPRAIDESLKAAQAWAVKFSDVVMERFRVEMKKKGYDL